MTYEEAKVKIKELQWRKWYQYIELEEDLITKGASGTDSGDLVWPRIRAMMPKDITGLRILDLGSNAGLFCIRAVQDGAGEAIGIEYQPQFVAQAEFVKQYYEERDNIKLPVTYHCRKIETISKELGRFDVVLGISVLYHLRQIEMVADKIAELTDTLIARYSYRAYEKLGRLTDTMAKNGFEITHNDGHYLGTRFLLRYDRR